MILNPNSNTVRVIRDALNRNDGYCPCGPERSPETKCPCKVFREDKKCHCNLYVENEVSK